MKKHAFWTQKKHRSHISGRRIIKRKNLQEILDRQVEKIRKDLGLVPPKHQGS